MIDPELAGVEVEKTAVEEKPKRKRTVRKAAKKDEEAQPNAIRLVEEYIRQGSLTYELR